MFIKMKNINRHYIVLFIFCLNFLMFSCGNAIGQDFEKTKVKFLDYFFENASVFNWEIQGDTIIKIFLTADYESITLNRQTDHWYFKLEADEGTHVRLIMSKTIADIYNGKLATNWWNYENGISCYISYDKIKWNPIKTSRLDNNELLIDFVLKEKSVYIARIPPYTEKDLELLKDRIDNHPLIKIIPIGHTLENRPLEIIRVGNPNANYSILLRARAHPWEPGGNWVIEGLINNFIENKLGREKWEKQFCYYIMPMANKDGVFRGMTRFNVAGKDLSRNWLGKIDSIHAPENYALEHFLINLIKNGHKPVLAIDFHNDDYGNIHLAQLKDNDKIYITKMELFRQKLSDQTWFSNKLIMNNKIAGGGNMADGMYCKFGIDAFIFELNANYIEELEKIPETNDWINLGAKLNEVFYQYLNEF